MGGEREERREREGERAREMGDEKRREERSGGRVYPPYIGIYHHILHIPSYTFIFPKSDHIPSYTFIYFKKANIRNMKAAMNSKSHHFSSPEAFLKATI